MFLWGSMCNGGWLTNGCNCLQISWRSWTPLRAIGFVKQQKNMINQQFLPCKLVDSFTSQNTENCFRVRTRKTRQNTCFIVFTKSHLRGARRPIWRRNDVQKASKNIFRRQVLPEYLFGDPWVPVWRPPGPLGPRLRTKWWQKLVQKIFTGEVVREYLLLRLWALTLRPRAWRAWREFSPATTSYTSLNRYTKPKQIGQEPATLIKYSNYIDNRQLLLLDIWHRIFNM